MPTYFVFNRSKRIHYKYDRAGNLIEKKEEINGKDISKENIGKALWAITKFTYDKNGNTIGIEDISGKSTKYIYDNAGRVEKVFDKDKTLAVYSYNSDDTIKAITYANGVITNYSYDGDKNIRSLITQTSKGEILIDYNYAYDLNGNRLQKVGSKNQSYYTYDSLNRLSSAKYNTQTKSLEESFTYDKAGNRLTRNTNSGIERYKYNAKNQLVELQKANGITKYNYDKQGNLTQEIHPEGINTYNYNSFNQTVKAETKAGNTLVSRYDAEGLRCEIEENDRLTKFIFNKDNIIAELDKDNNVKVRLDRGYEIVSTQIEETRYYYHQEEQGSTAYITDNAEAVQNSYFYDVFGCVLEEKEKVHNRFKYVGEQYDAVTQQYYLRARNYNPVIGRFLQEDIYRGDGLDLYSYCHNNPVRYYDPSGYMCSPKKNQNSAGGAGRSGVGTKGAGKAVEEFEEVTLSHVDGMPINEFNRKANALKELGDQGLLYKAQNPVSRNPAVTRGYRQDIIKRIWNQYGETNPEFGKKLIDRVTKRMQPDHVWELQLGGPDTVDNLKFLDSFTNWNIGTQQIRQQIRNLPTGTKIKIER